MSRAEPSRPLPLTRRALLAGSVSALTVGLARRPAAQAPAATPAPTFTEIRRGVGIFTLRGGTIGYLVNDAGALAVDSQYPDTAPQALAGLSRRSPKGVELLLNTHHHADHTGGNQVFRATARRIVAHVNCLEWHRRTAATAGTEGQQSFADTTFTDQWRSTFGDETVRARHYGAGHTGGDAVIHFERANVVHMGDLLFNRAHPNIDPPAGARVGHWISVLDTVSAAHAADTVFIAGHGRDNQVQCTTADLAHFRNYLTASLDAARKAIAAGQSRDELVKTASLPGFEDTIALNARLTQGFVLGVCFDELGGKHQRLAASG
ncbi:MAG: MBL fold metallo-hydrolase [Vicinamibacterales bacterium]